VLATPNNIGYGALLKQFARNNFFKDLQQILRHESSAKSSITRVDQLIQDYTA
jgi:hypothetical protein